MGSIPWNFPDWAWVWVVLRGKPSGRKWRSGKGEWAVNDLGESHLPGCPPFWKQDAILGCEGQHDLAIWQRPQAGMWRNWDVSPEFPAVVLCPLSGFFDGTHLQLQVGLAYGLPVPLLSATHTQIGRHSCSYILRSHPTWLAPPGPSGI